MLDSHILREIGEAAAPTDAPAQKGRRKVLLDVNETFKFAVGIYVDAQGICIGLTTLCLRVMEKQWFPCNALQCIDDIVPLVTRAFSSMLQNSCLQPEQLLGVGVGVMPSMLQQMQCRMETNGTYHFPELQKQLEICLGVPVFADHAVKLFAQAGLYEDGHHMHPYHQLFFCQDTHQHFSIVQATRTHCIVREIDALCIIPDGRELPGYPDGSVQAELSNQALKTRLSPLFSQDQTPALWTALNGRLDWLTLPVLLTASQSDTVLRPLAEEIMQKLVVLLYNLYLLYQPETVCLFQMGLTEENLEQLQQAAVRFIGIDFAKALTISTLQECYYFLCGCVCVIQHGFFESGGSA